MDTWSQAKPEHNVNLEMVKKYYNVTDKPEEADFAMVFVTGPYHNNDDRQEGGNGYLPIPLQYGTYTAATAREQSIAAQFIKWRIISVGKTPAQ